MLGIAATLFAACRLSGVANREVWDSANNQTNLKKLPGEARTLTFPGKQSIGALYLVPASAGHTALLFAKPIGNALGTVHVNVPAGSYILYSANHLVFDDPALLDQISAKGIDEMKLSYMSMSQAEDGYCDRLLKRLHRFPDLRYLNLDQSDATDEGIANAKELKHLRWISMNMCRISGSCFKDLKTLPELSTLCIERCTLLKTANFAYLAEFPKLERLELRWCNLSDDGIKLLEKCRTLRILGLSKNKLNGQGLKYLLALPRLESISLEYTDIGDAQLKYVSEMKPLKFICLKSTKVTDEGMRYLRNSNLVGIDLRNTRVTLKGIAQFKDMHLETLALPKSAYTPDERAFLKRIFPGVKLTLAPAQEETDVNMLIMH